MTLSILAPLLHGSLAPYAQRLLPPDAACDPVTGTSLLDISVLGAHLDRFALRYAGMPDRRANASLWLKHYLAAWLVPAVAVNLLFDHDLPLALDEVGIVFAAEGHAQALRLSGEGHPLPSREADTRFATITTYHLTPLIEVLAHASGAAPRVFWGNVGNVFENVVQQIAHLEPTAPGLTAARDYLAFRSLGAGWPNPLFQPIRYIVRGGQQRRQRRVCCLRYFIEELDLCATCPLTPKLNHSR